MTGREKILAALSAEGSSAVPAVFCYQPVYVRDHWDELTSCPWWYRFEPDIERQLSWHRDFVGRTGMDWLLLPDGYAREQRQALSIDERPEGVFLVDRLARTEKRLTRPPVGGELISAQGSPTLPGRLPETSEQMKALLPPTDPDPRAAIADGRADLAHALLDEFSDLFPIYAAPAPLWAFSLALGFEGMMTLVASRPDLVSFGCERLLTLACQRIGRAAHLGAAAIWIEDCMMDMIAPKAYRTLGIPFIQRLIAEVQCLGMKSIHYYCGNPADRWEDLCTTGADALSLEESKKGFSIDIEDAVAHVRGRCALLGNLDTDLLERGSEDKLGSEIDRQIVAGRRNGNRFIMSTGSPVTPGTTVARVRRYCELVREFGA